jgi:tetratricopeptide (TPR) repeat protein
MKGNRRLLTIMAAMGLAVGGLILFVGGLVLELFVVRPASGGVEVLSPAIQMALVGLCLSAGMFMLVFMLVGWMLAQQSRKLGIGYIEAYRLIENSQFREAIPLLERSIRDGKETSEVLMLLTSAYAYTGQLAKAQATADRSVELYPDNPESYVTLANGYRLQAAYDEAARVLRRAVELNPQQPIVWAELAFLHNFAGDEDAALAAFERAAAQPMPAVYGVRVYFHLMRAYLGRGDIEAAVRATAKMMSARHGLQSWKASLNAISGTAYGQALQHEIATIEQALQEADSGNLG